MIEKLLVAWAIILIAYVAGFTCWLMGYNDRKAEEEDKPAKKKGNAKFNNDYVRGDKGWSR